MGYRTGAKTIRVFKMSIIKVKLYKFFEVDFRKILPLLIEKLFLLLLIIRPPISFNVFIIAELLIKMKIFNNLNNGN